MSIMLTFSNHITKLAVSRRATQALKELFEQTSIMT